MAFDPVVSLGIIALYGVITLGIGLYAWTRSSSKTLDQYFLADRKIGWFVGFFSIAASQFSALTMIGFIAFYFNFGIGAFIAITGGALLFYAGSLYFLAPRIWKVGTEFSHITPSDTVAQYYDSQALRYVVAVGMILALLPYLQVQFSGIGIALEIGSGGLIPVPVGAAIIALIIAVYTILGGMKSVAWVDTMQGILLLGASFVGGLVLLFTVGGGVQNAFTTLLSQKPGLISIPGPQGVFDWRHILTFSIPVFLGWLYHPYIWMRINYFENGEMMEHLPWVFMGIFWLTQFGGFATVLAGATIIPNVAPDKFLLLMYQRFFPTAIFAVIASAAIAAMMSSASSICHSIAAVVSN
ncbi:MAG: sodium:solute symporter, partial [Candidatus Nanohaloarchaea archaeon]